MRLNGGAVLRADLDVDADMDACVAIEPGPAYNACWAALDQKLIPRRLSADELFADAARILGPAAE